MRLFVLKLFFLNALVAARNHFAQGGEIVHPIHGADDELPVIGFLHAAIFPDDHGRDGFCALNVRNVEALYSPRKFGKAKRVLQCFLDGARVWLHYPEALVVKLLGITGGEINE